jgi:hypothetical protein
MRCFFGRLWVFVSILAKVCGSEEVETSLSVTGDVQSDRFSRETNEPKVRELERFSSNLL